MTQVLYPHQKPRGFLEYILFQVGQLDGANGTSFEEASTFFASFGYQLTPGMWESWGEMFTSERILLHERWVPDLPEFRYSYFEDVHQSLVQLGFFDPSGIYLGEGVTAFEKRLQIFGVTPRKRDERVLSRLVEQHQTAWEVTHRPDIFGDKFSKRLARWGARTFSLGEEIDLSSEREFLTWFLLTEEPIECREKKGRLQLETLKGCLQLSRRPLVPPVLEEEAEQQRPSRVVSFMPVTASGAVESGSIGPALWDWAHWNTADGPRHARASTSAGMGVNVRQYLGDSEFFVEALILLAGYYSIRGDEVRLESHLRYAPEGRLDLGYTLGRPGYFFLDEVELRFEGSGRYDETIRFSGDPFRFVLGLRTLKIGAFSVRADIGQLLDESETVLALATGWDF